MFDQIDDFSHFSFLVKDFEKRYLSPLVLNECRRDPYSRTHKCIVRYKVISPKPSDGMREMVGVTRQTCIIYEIARDSPRQRGLIRNFWH